MSAHPQRVERDRGVRGKRLAAKGDEWFWHVLALVLGGRSLVEWKERILPEEFIAWQEFYKLHPFDDYARFYRPAALVAHSLGGAEVGLLLDWLARESPAASSDLSDADLATMKALGFTPPRKG